AEALAAGPVDLCPLRPRVHQHHHLLHRGRRVGRRLGAGVSRAIAGVGVAAALGAAALAAAPVATAPLLAVATLAVATLATTALVAAALGIAALAVVPAVVAAAARQIAALPARAGRRVDRHRRH